MLKGDSDHDKLWMLINSLIYKSGFYWVTRILQVKKKKAESGSSGQPDPRNYNQQSDGFMY